MMLIVLFLCDINSLQGKWFPRPTKRLYSRRKIISPSIWKAKCSSLEQIVVAFDNYNIAVMALYIILSTAVQTDC